MAGVELEVVVVVVVEIPLLGDTLRFLVTTVVLAGGVAVEPEDDDEDDDEEEEELDDEGDGDGAFLFFPATGAGTSSSLSDSDDELEEAPADSLDLAKVAPGYTHFPTRSPRHCSLPRQY